MTKVLENYEINPDTMAILPAKEVEYDTIVIEKHAKYYVKQTPLKMIKLACLDGGSNYQGRREAVTHLTGAMQKMPIPINPNLNIYAFPTHSPSNMDCMWLFYQNILQLKPAPPHDTTITFTNNESITINCSYYTMEKQLHRTSYCVIRFSNQAMAMTP
ncbi:competence protein ComK [Bacillus shivajii]|uniref:competence protein ComK n=1 Tax=Bacillus shivajii TaxID=1983719 RepID=UPI001CFA20E0|nr:competence protein ComK [Bacillus shivajii]UCZ52935.1 competence protein ComK [Bacillus shivajii]